VGPGPGRHGGTIVTQGSPAEVAAFPTSLTGMFLRLTGQLDIAALNRRTQKICNLRRHAVQSRSRAPRWPTNDRDHRRLLNTKEYVAQIGISRSGNARGKSDELVILTQQLTINLGIGDQIQHAHTLSQLAARDDDRANKFNLNPWRSLREFFENGLTACRSQNSLCTHKGQSDQSQRQNVK
jgi:hypothetical protein